MEGKGLWYINSIQAYSIYTLSTIYIDLDKPEIHQITLPKAHTGYLFHVILTGSPDS